jgi:hypothetical protein
MRRNRKADQAREIERFPLGFLKRRGDGGESPSRRTRLTQPDCNRTRPHQLTLDATALAPSGAKTLVGGTVRHPTPHVGTAGAELLIRGFRVRVPGGARDRSPVLAPTTADLLAGPRIISTSDFCQASVRAFRVGDPLQSRQSVASPVMLHSADAGASALLVASGRRVPRWVRVRCRCRRRGRGRRVAREGRRSRGQLLRTARVRRRPRRNAIRRRQGRTPDLSGGAGRDRRRGVALRGRICGVAGRGRGCGGAGRLLYKSHRAVASAHSGRNSEQTREHENRERRCRHDGCAHDTRTHDKGLAHRGASLVVTRRAALRPRLPEALRVPRRAVLQCTSAWLREGLGSRQEIVVAPGHDSNPSSHRLIAAPHPPHGGRTRERSRRLVRPVGGRRHPRTVTRCLPCGPGGLLRQRSREFLA